jgi:hypothetical protein
MDNGATHRSRDQSNVLRTPPTTKAGQIADLSKHLIDTAGRAAQLGQRIARLGFEHLRTVV